MKLLIMKNNTHPHILSQINKSMNKSMKLLMSWNVKFVLKNKKINMI
jgi:hypothetical protein